MAAPTMAYSYVRFSTPEQAKGDSERRQIEEARAYAVSHDLTFDESLTYADKGVSAYHGGNRKGGDLGLFLAAVECGAVAKGSFLLVESVDRISRQAPWDAIDTLKDIVNAGVTLVTLTDRRRYGLKELRTDPMALVYLTVLLMRAHEESKMKSVRVGAAWGNKRKRAREQGHKLTKVAPAWIEVRGELHEQRTTHLIPDRAKVIRSIFADYLAGH